MSAPSIFMEFGAISVDYYISESLNSKSIVMKSPVIPVLASMWLAFSAAVFSVKTKKNSCRVKYFCLPLR